MDSKQLMSEIAAELTQNDIPILIKSPEFSIWQTGDFFNKNQLMLSFLDDTISEKCTEIYWAAGSLQISLGDFLIIKNSDEFLSLEDMLTLHRINIIYEQIYRIWERYTSLLAYLFFNLESKRNFYFNNLISELKPFKAKLINFSNLSKLNAKWDSLASRRNTISHELASLTANITVAPEISQLVDFNGENIVHIKTDKKTKEDYFSEIKIYLDDVQTLNSEIQNFILENATNIFQFNTFFPWTKFSLKSPREKKEEYLVYKLGQYYIQPISQFLEGQPLTPSQDYVFWQKLGPPPKQLK